VNNKANYRKPVIESELIGSKVEPSLDISSNPLIPLSRGATNTGPKRARYFSYYRNERMALRVLEYTQCTSYSYKEYRAIRHMYYFVYPHLCRILQFPPDMERVRLVGYDLYMQIQSYRYIKSGPKGTPSKELHFEVVRRNNPPIGGQRKL
jgi:hypothetical protein